MSFGHCTKNGVRCQWLDGHLSSNHNLDINGRSLIHCPVWSESHWYAALSVHGRGQPSLPLAPLMSFHGDRLAGVQ